MTERTVFITAGLNVGTSPMSAEDANAFSNAIRSAIVETGGTLFFVGTGVGSWEGLTEASLVFGAIVPEFDHSHSGRDVLYLGDALRLIAARFRQDAIGFTVHDSAKYGPSYVESVR